MTTNHLSTEFEIERLRGLALVDELTGLANRRAFLERLQAVYAAALAGGPGFALLLLDLDGLKDVNDTFGYTAGDRALQEFAAALLEAVRGDDLVCRIGGDEFAVIVSESPAAEAARVLERVQRIARGVVRAVHEGGPEVILVAGMGRGRWTPQVESVEAIFAQAETELIAAKAAALVTPDLPGAFRPRGRRALGEELRALLAMARQVATSSGTTDLLHRVAEQAAALIGARLAGIALVTAENLVQIDEVWGEGAWRAFPSQRPLGQGVLGRTAATGVSEMHNVIRPELTHDLASAEALGLESILAVPLRDRQGATFGVLTLGNKRGGLPFLESDVGLAQAFADLAASAIENTRSFSATEEARAYQHALMEQAHDAIVVVEPGTGRVLDANAALAELTGYSAEELRVRTLADLGLTSISSDEQRPGAGPARPDSVRRKDSAPVPVEVSVSRIETRRGPLLLAIIRDVRERLRTEAELRGANQRLQALTDQAGDAILRTDVRGQVLDANAMAEQVLGRDHDQLSGMQLSDFLADAGEGRLLRLRARLQRRGALRQTLRLRRTPDQTFSAEVSASLVDGEVLYIIRDIDERLAVEGETRRRNAELEARNAVAALLTQAQSLEGALNAVLPIICRTGEVAGALVMLLDDQGRLRLTAGHDVPPALAAVLSSSPARFGERLTGGAAAARTPTVINNIAEDPRIVRQETRDSGLQSIVVLPLVAGGRALGVLGAGAYHTDAFDDRRVARLRAFADQIAVWTDSRLHLQEMEDREQDARFLAALGEALNQTQDEAPILRRLVEGVAHKFGGGVAVVLRDATTESWRQAAAAHTNPALTATVAEALGGHEWVSGKDALDRCRTAALYDLSDPGEASALPPWLERAERFGLQSLLTVPLSAGGDVLGVLTAGNRHDEPRLTARHLALAQQIAQHAAVAIANARAYRDADQSRAFLRALMDQASEAILVCDHTRMIVDANAAAEELTGLKRADLIGRALAELVHPRDRERAATLFTASDPSGRTARGRLRLRHADGRTLALEAGVSLVDAPGGTVHMALLRDVSDEIALQRQREQLLTRVRAEGERARLLLDLAGELGRADDPDAVMQSAVDACRRLAPVGRAVLYSWDGEAENFAFRAGAGLSAEEAAFLRALIVAASQVPLAGAPWRRCADRLAGCSHAGQRARSGDRVAGPPRDRDLSPPRGWRISRLHRCRPKAPSAPLHGTRSHAPHRHRTPDRHRTLRRLRPPPRGGARDYLQAVMRHAGDGIAVTDLASGDVVDVNDRLCAIAGYPREALLGRPLLQLVAPEEQVDAGALIAQIRADGDPPPARSTLLHMDGTAIPVEVSNARVRVGGRTLVVRVVRDLRGRVERERRLRFDAQVLASMSDAVVAVDREGRIIFWNRGAVALFGLGEEMMGLSFLAVMPPDELPHFVTLFGRLRAEAVATADVPLHHADGRPIVCHVTLTRMRDQHGRSTGTIGLIRDVTTQREAEARLHLFAQMVSSAGEAILAVGLEGMIAYANPAAHRMLGYPPEGLVGLHGPSLFATTSAVEAVRDVTRTAIQSGWHGEVGVRRADGTCLVMRGTASAWLSDAGRAAGIVIVAEDATAEFRAQRAQQALLARLSEANATVDERTAELRAVAEISGILVAGGEPEAVFRALARRMLEAGTFDVITVSVFDAARQEICLREVQHRLTPPPYAMLSLRGQTWTRGEMPLLDRMLTERRPMVVHYGDPTWRASFLIRESMLREGLSLSVSTPLLYHGEFVGMLSLYARTDRDVQEDELRLLQALADHVAAAIHTAGSLDRIREMRRDAIFRLALACETRDADTGTHLRRIQATTAALCRELGLPGAETEETALASVLHDIGKIAVPEAVLKKKGSLEAEEIELIRRHTLHGEAMLAGPDFYETARRIARSHHERWDGDGYPDRFARLAIPRPARIVAVADVFDALISRRVYKPAWDQADAAREILERAGTHFDPEVVAAFEALWRSGRFGAVEEGAAHPS